MARKQYLFFRRMRHLLAFSFGLLLVALMGIRVWAGDISTTGAIAHSSTTSLLHQSQTLYESGKYREAIEGLQRAADEFKASGDKLRQAMALSNLSLTYQQLGQWQEAEQAITDSLNLLHQTPNNSPEYLKLFPQFLEVQGKLQLALGKPEDALKVWQESAAKYAQLGDKIGTTRTQIHQSLAMQELGLYRQALKTLIQPVQFLQTQPDSLLKAIAFRSLGNVLRVVGNIPELETFLPLLQQQEQGKKLSYLDHSQKLLQQSLEISQRKKSPQDSAEALLGLGNTARAAYYRAKDAYERRAIPSVQTEAQRQGKIALDYYQQVATTAFLPSLRIQAQLNQLSLLLDFEKWLQTIKAQPTNEIITPQLQAKLDELPTLQSQIDNLPDSRTAIYARINLARSEMKLETLENQQSIEPLLVRSVNQAQRLQDRRAQAYALGHLGGLYEKTKQFYQAQSLTQKAIMLTEEIQAPDIAYQWQWQLGRVLKQQDKTESAIAAYEEAVKTLDFVRQDLVSLSNPDFQFSFRDNVEPVYRELVDLLLQPPSTSIAEMDTKRIEDERENVTFASRRTALNPQPLLPRGEGEKDFKVPLPGGEGFRVRADKDDMLPDDTRKKASSTPENLKKARKYIEDLQLAELEDYLRCRLQNTNSVPIDQVVEQNNLPSAVIYPIILANRLEVILKLPGQKNLIHYTTEVPQPEVESTIQQLRSAIEQRGTGKNNRLFQQVYDWLIRPAEVELQESNIKTLVFVLDGSLRNIPMAALYDGKSYLIEKYSIAGNLGLQLTEDKPLKIQEVKVLIAGLSESRQNFSALPYIESELKQIQSKLSNSQVLLNSDFTTQTLQERINSQPFSVVHLATHGLFSSSPEETFILTYDEHININQLNTLLRSREQTRPDAIELLVLSACQTAIGDRRAALGIAGVSVRAGARSTIASLFNVNDASTSFLMKVFYQELTKPNVTKAEALRHAQLALWEEDEDYKMPFHWAPHMLLGNWR